MQFNSYTELREHVLSLDIGKIFPMEGIFKNKRGNVILRSIHEVSFYKDNVSIDNEYFDYTFYGPIGDQDLNNYRNKRLTAALENKTGIYLYYKKGKKYYWIGKVSPPENYSIERLQHPDRAQEMRTIYRIRLKSVHQ